VEEHLKCKVTTLLGTPSDKSMEDEL